ncbi:hypothetical protein GN325_01250 [Agrobacterium vitis]|uniref:hypothetical protein n=1 Tax=Agrobacterium vitis TaxID=373 RepID=UPI0012E7BEDB|nr:hypothetical protein [Agrobacterium vitis]MVB00440.1 hypothetical protein [Agrobacterium vitis]
MPEDEIKRTPSQWRIILAFILDLFSSFFVLGYIVGYLSGGLTPDGFQLNGLPAFIMFALVIAYFVVFNRFLGGTIWKRILRANY